MPSVYIICVLATSLQGMFTSPREPEHIKAADAVAMPFCERLCNEKRLQLCGYGGAMQYQVNEYDMYFVSHDQMELSEARRLVVASVLEFLNLVNEDGRVRPFLKNFPFTEKNVNFVVSYRHESDCVPSKYVALVRLSKGKIYYNNCAGDPDKLSLVKVESFAEAVALVRQGSDTDIE